jgi:hypothetical protein
MLEELDKEYDKTLEREHENTRKNSITIDLKKMMIMVLPVEYSKPKMVHSASFQTAWFVIINCTIME